MKIDFILEKIIETPGSAFFYTASFYSPGPSFIFSGNPITLTASSPKEIPAVLTQVDEQVSRGYPGFGFISYEAGYSFEEKLVNLFEGKDENLLKFWCYRDNEVAEIKSEDIEIDFEGEEFPYQVSDFKLNTSKEKYISSIDRIKKYIEEGDTYQVNFTVKGEFNLKGDLLSFLKIMIFNQSAGYISVINTGRDLIISLSPELFFRIDNGKITSLPMKGTISRGKNPSEDSLRKYELQASKKEQAENLMIVDLLRNDIGRISGFGKVKVNELYRIEKYETLFQMVSEIEGELKKGIPVSEIIKNIFPCGSITGAPKIRTMQIIKELETENRGIYTGAIGFFHKGKIAFNVAIRTIILNMESMRASIGLGSGVVWDSKPENEYNEVYLKSRFALTPNPYFELFETMLVEKGKIFLLNEHLERLGQSAEYFLFRFDKNKILMELSAVLKKMNVNKFTGEKYRMKLNLLKSGRIKIKVSEYTDEPGQNMNVIISPKNISSENPFQYFKTTNRKLYDNEYSFWSSKGFFEVIFINEKNQVAEGAVSNIFIKKGGLWFTPPVSCGILPGTYRRHWFLTDLNLKEEIIFKDDLLIADEMVLTNSLRGKCRIKRLYLNEAEFKEFN